MTEHQARTGGQPHAYRHAVEALRKPWAIVEETFDTVCSIVSMRARGERLSDEEISARIGAAQRDRDPAPIDTGSVAVLPLYGVIYPKANLMTQVSGATSVQAFQKAVREALDDPAVTSVLLDVDSPGGLTDLVPELATEVREGRKRKPIVAVANTDMGSAAYWIGSQASELVVTPSGQVGSIGVFMAHFDRSAKLEMEGLRPTVVSAGRFKVERGDWGPLSEDAVAAMQGEVDEFYGMFVAAVAKGRGTTVENVRAGYGEGRMMTARRALEAGMVDRVETFEETLGRRMRAGSRPAARATMAPGTFTAAASFAGEGITAVGGDSPSFVDETQALRDRADALVERSRSLAEVRDKGRLTAAKREQLTACTGALRESVETLERLLADTSPTRHRDEASRQLARLHKIEFERSMTR